MPTYQTITVDITPGAKEKPVLNASQFDNGRPFAVALTWGGVPFTDTGDYDIEIHVKKPDGNIVTAEPDSVVNEVCSFLTTEQMCACHGINECEIVLFDNDIQIGTGNFTLDVEKAPDEGGIQSASEIANLTQQIEQIVPEVIGDDYYNKTQTDALLANKADISDLPDMTNYYDKSQTDTLLAAKADTSSLASVAFSGNYNDLNNTPVIPTQVQADYTQADTTAVDYIKNKPDISGMIAAALLAVMPVETATGNPCTFETDIADNLVSLKAAIVASQDLHGYDHPWAGGGGKNKLPKGENTTGSGVTFVVDDLGIQKANGTSVGTVFGKGGIFTLPAGSYILTGCPTNSNGITIDIRNQYGGSGIVSGGDSGNGLSFTLSETTTGYVNIRIPSGVTVTNLEFKPMIRLSSVADKSFAPYENICPIVGHSALNLDVNGDTFTVSFGQTVYGGEYDANAGKVKPNIYYPSYNGETIIGRWLSSKDVYVEGATPTMGAQVVCLDEYDTEIDVSELSVDTIVGVNNIVSDCGGDVTASYKVSFQKYVDDQ